MKIRRMIEESNLIERKPMIELILSMLEPVKLRAVYNAMEMAGDFDKKPKNDFNKIYA